MVRDHGVASRPVGPLRSWIVPVAVMAAAIALTWGDWGTMAVAVGILTALEVGHRVSIRRSVERDFAGPD